MGFNDIFRKRKNIKERKKEFLEPGINSFLIVTEGKCTEPNYFKGIQNNISKSTNGFVDIVEIPRIDIHGQGVSTMQLIEDTSKIIKKAKIMYQNIWVVFDKDDFIDFNDAIIKGEKQGYNIAWSNQSFEYWIYLHFSYSDAALHRNDWEKKLDSLFRENKLGNKKYEKNNKELFEILNSFDGPKIDINNAKKRMANYNKSNKPSEYDPGTTVYKLVETLLEYVN